MRDQDIRQILINELTAKFRDHKDTILVHELGLFQGKSRIDIAIINGSLYGYEIKSDSDNLLRLDDQLQAYSKVFDYLTFIVGPSHLTKVKAKLPRWCGLYIAETKSNHLKIKKLRTSAKNQGIEANSLVQLIWRDEALDILRKLDKHHGLSKATRATIWERLTEKVNLKALKNIIRSTLISRRQWRESNSAYKL